MAKRFSDPRILPVVKLSIVKQLRANLLMNDEQFTEWQETRLRGRADFALRNGILYGPIFWGIHFVCGGFSDVGDLFLGLPFYLCVFVAACWFCFWPMRERDYQRPIERRGSKQGDNVA